MTSSVYALILAGGSGERFWPLSRRARPKQLLKLVSSRTLLEEVKWDEQKVTSIDWSSYPPLFLGANVPKIETVLINRSDGITMGAGETAITVTAAAIANAVFDATGARIRQVPFSRERVKAALDART